jgi:hypothetical protein
LHCQRCIEHGKELDRVYMQQSGLRLEAEMEARRLHRLLDEKAELLAEAQARLADLVVGAEMMLEPFMRIEGAMRRYVEEVKRVAGTPLGSG